MSPRKIPPKIEDESIYLECMSKPLQEKLKIVSYIPEKAKNILDVGCADGAVTIAMANLFPWIKFHGIDLNPRFITSAKKHGVNLNNSSFEQVYLRELLAGKQKYDVIIFCSVLHEFFTYGEGISSVLKALSDAHELLTANGTIIIRDMILSDYTKRANLKNKDILQKIHSNLAVAPLLADFEATFGVLDTHHKINHFLLKYMYENNWERELKENYIPVTFEQYEKIFDLLGMRVQYKESYLIEYLKNLWSKDFKFSNEELVSFKSTGILVAEKNGSN